MIKSGTHASIFICKSGNVYVMGERIGSRMNLGNISKATKVPLPDKYKPLDAAPNQGRKPQPCFHLICHDKELNKKVLLSAGYNDYGVLGQGSGDNKYE